jgi:hypothetical protein
MMTIDPQSRPVPANMPLTITLEAQQWNSVMAALAETPYRIAAPLIQAISEQLQQQAATVAEAEQTHPQARVLPTGGNGLDRDPPPMTPPVPKETSLD